MINSKFIKKVLKLIESTINGIYENFENLLNINEKDFNEKYDEEQEFEDEDKFKLTIIVEFFKQKDKENNGIQKSINDMNNIIINKRAKNQIDEKEIKEKNDKNLINQDIYLDKDIYLFYNVIKIYEYKNSEKK